MVNRVGIPKRWPLRNRNRTENNMNQHVKRHRISDIKTGIAYQYLP